jgi:hypothetical protein
MIGKQSTRQLYASMRRDGGPGNYVRRMYHLMGLKDRHGRDYRDQYNRRILKDPMGHDGRPQPRLLAEEFSLRDLCEGILGDANVEARFNPSILQRANLFEQSQPIMEAGTGAIAASQFSDINAFTAVVAGLLEIKILEQFENPAFIADKLMPPDPTKMFAGRKVIGATRMGDVAEVRLPGMPTARINIGERWITQPPTVENALSSEVTQEAVFLDLTGEVLQNASDVGTWLGYRKELRCIDAFIGVPYAQTYSYKGTAYQSFISNGYFNNDLTGQELFHWDQVQTCVRKGTLIDTDKGPIAIDKLDPAMHAIMFVDAENKVAYTRSYKSYKNGFKPLVRVEADDGMSIDVTADHKFFVGFAPFHCLQANELKCGDKLQIRAKWANIEEPDMALARLESVRPLGEADEVWDITNNAPCIEGEGNFFAAGFLVHNCLLAFRDMKDPETNTRIMTDPNMVLVNMEKRVTAESIMGTLARDAEYRDAPGSTTNPQEVRIFNQPYKGRFEILDSPLVYQRCTDATGLNLSPTNAGKYWWMWQKGKPIKYATNWGIRTQQAAPAQAEMIDRGIVLYVKADERGTPFWFEPRFVVRNRP